MEKALQTETFNMQVWANAACLVANLATSAEDQVGAQYQYPESTPDVDKKFVQSVTAINTGVDSVS